MNYTNLSNEQVTAIVNNLNLYFDAPQLEGVLRAMNSLMGESNAAIAALTARVEALEGA